MNYIKTLQNERQDLTAEVCGLRGGLADLRRYLALPKFHEDTTVQVQDVLNRLEAIEAFAAELVADTQSLRNRRHHFDGEVV